MSDLSHQDTYQVYCRDYLGEDNLRVLTLLYQPICETQAFATYLTLYHEVERSHIFNTPSTHYRILRLTQLSLTAFQTSLVCLEGLGLVRTYEKKAGKQADYIYEILMPLTPQQFFDNALLNTMLAHALGDVDYEKTRYYFSCPVIDQQHYQPVTHAFDEVFHIDLNGTKILQSNGNFSDDKRKEPELHYDLELFYRGLQDYQIPRHAITKDIQKTIVQLGTLYHIAPSVMKEMVYDVYHDGQITTADLTERCRRYYEFENQGIIKKAVQKPVGPQNMRQVKISQFESLSPYEYLKALQNGAKPTARDLHLIEKALTEQNLPSAVVNVIIDLVLQLNDGQFPRRHFETLCGLFARKGVKDVTQAMKQAKAYVNSLNQSRTVVDVPKPKKEVMPSELKKTSQEDYDILRKEITAMLKGEG